MKETDKNTGMGMAVGMCLGLAIGSAMDNIPIGLCFGLALGLAFGSHKDREVNRQLAEKGYTIKAIEEIADTGEYRVILTDRDGAESTVTVSQEQMEEESFSVGDVVFLNEDGLIEQAFDKDEA